MEMDLGHIWSVMSPVVKAIMALLVFLSVYSLGVSLERWWTFRAAKKQSVKFALEIGPLLKQEKLKADPFGGQGIVFRGSGAT